MNPVEYFLQNPDSFNFGFWGQGSMADFFVFLKITLVVFSVFFIFHIAYMIIKINEMQGKSTMFKEAVIKKTPPVYKGEFVVRWAEIEKRVETQNEAEYKLAIIEADKVFDDLLKRMMIKGEDMGGRLKSINVGILPSLDRVWAAHKIRNKIAHEAGFHLEFSEAEEVIRIYRKALRELKILI